MPSKQKNADKKRTKQPRSSDYTKAFVKDWERLSRAGRFDMNRLKHLMLMLIANDGPLGAEWLDHPLKGEWADYRECHVGGDFLLIYQIEGQQIIFVRVGTHADLFE